MVVGQALASLIHGRPGREDRAKRRTFETLLVQSEGSGVMAG